MPSFYLGVACFLLVTMIVGLVRVFRGPNQEDRVVAVQLFGTTGVAIVLLLAVAFDAPAIRNAALVFALLAVLAVVAFVRGEIDESDAEKNDRRIAPGE
ncbi:monovalent cation/H+ antiporter complex subunit F [Desulfonatronum parangueonense]